MAETKMLGYKNTDYYPITTSKDGIYQLSNTECMPNLIGQAIDWSKYRKTNEKITTFDWLAYDTIKKDEIFNAFLAMKDNDPRNWGDNYNNSTILSEAIIPANNLAITPDNVNYRAKDTLFLGVFYNATDDNSWTMDSAEVKAPFPYMVWVKYDDVKKYIIKDGAIETKRLG
ncbi:hypothetical protein [Lactobacillus sp. HT06-2]|uniref:hypothetical protein n=1 Tax=Lactobacillus sp. HT06-2 TaxID=2080222 RepID=UPI000CD938B7|nr:hypothetical protein [Lactobacillus sp. HT06-2]